jgi:hypothetical protein
MARLPDPAVNLAAYGGIVFPLALLIEAPIIMMLAASTALSRSRTSYRKLRRFMFAAGGALSLLHFTIAATPMYEWVVGELLGAPDAIRAPARLGLLILTPWTFSIAYRRFQQGVLIRYGRSRLVGLGTAVRLAAIAVVLGTGYALGGPGIVVGASAVSTGVLSEALFVGWVVRPVVANRMPAVDENEIPLTRSRFLRFYAPLALTSLLNLSALSIGSAAMGRMFRPIDSLAVWPVLNGLTFTLRSLGFAYNEVVVALLEKRGAARSLVRVAAKLAAVTSAMLLAVAATPLSTLWFERVSSLTGPLTELARAAIWIAIPMPALAAAQSWFQGILVHGHRTRAVSEAVVLYLLTYAVALLIALRIPDVPGIYLGFVAALAATIAQTAWLAWRSRDALRRNEEAHGTGSRSDLL